MAGNDSRVIQRIEFSPSCMFIAARYLGQCIAVGGPGPVTGDLITVCPVW